MRVLFFDTESTNLDAAWGRILCSSFVPLDGEPYTFRGDRRPYKSKVIIDDSRLCAATRDELEAADIIVGWNSIRHDIPLLNARLALYGERPCRLAERNGTRHLDLMWYSGGSSMKIGGRRLDTVAKYFKTPSQKTPLNAELWQLAGAGDKKAMNEIVEHCEFDCLVLKELFPHLAPGISKFQFTMGEVWPLLTLIPSRRNAA
jgi:uncharacterized protein YprB with RNaseH-like and TPR domain